LKTEDSFLNFFTTMSQINLQNGHGGTETMPPLPPADNFNNHSSNSLVYMYDKNSSQGKMKSSEFHSNNHKNQQNNSNNNLRHDGKKPSSRESSARNMVEILGPKNVKSLLQHDSQESVELVCFFFLYSANAKFI
jgi:hypothetical protein